MSDVRPVWLTREQRDYLDWAKNHAFAHDLRNLSAAYEGIIAAWDAAPADATGVFCLAMDESHTDTIDWTDDARAVLRALGRPA